MELSNVLLGLGILIPSLLFLTGILRLCGRRHNFRLQLFYLVFFSVAIIGSFYYIFGKAVALYLVSGLGLGIGFALRPVFSKILSGAIFDATHVMGADEVKLTDAVKGKIVQVGLLHTWLYNDNGSLFMIGNKYLEEHPVEVILTEEQKKELKLKSPFSSSQQSLPTSLKFV